MKYGEGDVPLILDSVQEIKAVEAGRRAIGIAQPELHRQYDNDNEQPSTARFAVITPHTLRPEYNVRIEISQTSRAEAIACFDSVLCLGGIKGIKASILGYKRAAREVLSFFYG